MPNAVSSHTEADPHAKIKDFIEAGRHKNDQSRKSKGPNDMLDKDSFLKLLITELSHQDPLQPTNDREFISQMAQFSALEQMNNVANSMNSLKQFQANLLVGRNITGRDFISGKTVSGKVDSVIHSQDGNVFFRVNGKSVKMTELISVDAEISVQSDKTSQTEEKNVSHETLNMKVNNNLKIINDYTENQKETKNTKIGE
ncbi:MAG: hypothetical protein OEZ13_01220 [Spirochaetia bacterium]|nr:hypothetical protein [Spirochaetia bacterium]